MTQPITNEELAEMIGDAVKSLLLLPIFSAAHESMTSHLEALLDLQLERAIGPNPDIGCCDPAILEDR